MLNEPIGWSGLSSSQPSIESVRRPVVALAALHNPGRPSSFSTTAPATSWNPPRPFRRRVAT